MSPHRTHQIIPSSYTTILNYAPPPPLQNNRNKSQKTCKRRDGITKQTSKQCRNDTTILCLPHENYTDSKNWLYHLGNTLVPPPTNYLNNNIYSFYQSCYNTLSSTSTKSIFNIIICKSTYTGYIHHNVLNHRTQSF